MIKSKRGRKPKNKPIDETLQLYDASGNIIENNVVSKDTNLANVTDPSNNLPKKRGRKPKGGKIIPNTVANSKIVCVMPNIIFHETENEIDENLNSELICCGFFGSLMMFQLDDA